MFNPNEFSAFLSQAVDLHMVEIDFSVLLVLFLKRRNRCGFAFQELGLQSVSLNAPSVRPL